MEIRGQIGIKCTPDALAQALHDPRVIHGLLPQGAKIEATGPGAFGFTISRSFGLLRLTLPGNMTLAPRDQGPSQTLTARAAHMVGGKLDLDLDMDIQPAPEGCRLSYSGTVEASGLAGRVLKDYAGRVNSAVKASMIRLKLMTETRARHRA